MSNPIIKYEIILAKSVYDKLENYKKCLESSSKRPGLYLSQKLSNVQDLEKLSKIEFLEILLSTKKPQIFAETQVKGQGYDWNGEELSILGDISVGFPAEIYDNGVWSMNDSHFIQHAETLQGYLVFTPGPLLSGKHIPDYQEIVKIFGINQEAYNSLITRRLGPVLHYINQNCEKIGKPALITCPGLGCGAFSGNFHGTVGSFLKSAIESLLKSHGSKWPNIKCFYFDPYNECSNEDQCINGINFRVRPSMSSLKNAENKKSQLCTPPTYGENEGEIENFGKCDLYKIVAWDHVSLPGNDYFSGSRNTDDGVSGAATNCMAIITGIEGEYSKSKSKYLPPKKYENSLWIKIATDLEVHLNVKESNLTMAKDF